MPSGRPRSVAAFIIPLLDDIPHYVRGLFIKRTAHMICQVPLILTRLIVEVIPSSGHEPYLLSMIKVGAVIRRRSPQTWPISCKKPEPDREGSKNARAARRCSWLIVSTTTLGSRVLRHLIIPLCAESGARFPSRRKAVQVHRSTHGLNTR